MTIPHTPTSTAITSTISPNVNNITADDLCIRQLKQLWFCRSLLFCNGAKRLAKERFHQDEIPDLLELEEEKLEDKKPSVLYKTIKKQSQKLIETHILRQGSLFSNLEQINHHFGLSNIETDIILFATLIELDSAYGNCYDLYGSLSNRNFYPFLANILNVSTKQITEVLNKDSLLHKSGLLKLHTSSREVDQKFDLLKSFCNALDTPQQTIESLFSDFIMPAPAAELTALHYNHIKKDYSRLSKYLAVVCNEKIKGANILIYGPPGTGKTQWVRTLVNELNIKLYEISVEDAEGDVLSGKERVTACQLAQKLLEKGNNQALLFDEIEDLFQTDMFAQIVGSSHRNTQTNKGWINQLLENNAVPTFWLSNDISSMNDSFLRRFDLVFELPIPPHSVRKKMLLQSLDNTAVSEKWIERMSHLEHLPPAIIDRATRVNKIIGESTLHSNEKNLEQIIGNTLKAMGHKHRAINPISSNFYDPNLINTKAPLEKISQGLNSSRNGRLCFFGPPGTGKSAYAKYLANYLEIPLIAKRASDIIDCYLGNTEKNIANMFEQATKEKGLLLLDEADSFLRERKNNQHSWETTQVNELLVQMENFKGIFICSTNLMDNLDTAALRRFDFKLEFTYLKTEQAWLLLKGFLNKAVTNLPSKKKIELKKQLASIQHLTPGDFATIQRKLTLLDELDNANLFIKELKQEVNFKNESSERAIGFSADF
ncbi:MAG: AAA family ATPase [Methylococcales bacterium]|nr:AAA family ATPase [Methylococcales bacterium]